MKNLRERWRGLTVLGVVAFAAVCTTVAPAPSFADIAGGGGGGGPITEWCSDGRPKTGLVRCEDGNLRYFDPETGAMVTNQWHNEYEAVWYYFGADGTAVSGWQSIGGDKYYFYPESHDMAYGRVQIDGKNYFLNTPGANADGRMQHSDWLYDSIYGKWFYATSSGELLTGWHNIGGTWYYFDEYGVMLTGWINVSGTWYYANASGAMATGWLNIGGTWYYLDGSGAMVANSWRSLGGSWYWFGDSGAMATGWFLAGGSWYYASGSGAMATGWLSNGGTWYWLGGSGAMASTLGLTLVEFGTGSTIPARWSPAGVRSAAPGTTLAVPALWPTTPGSATTTSSLPVPWLRMPGLAPTMSARTASGFRAMV